MSADDRLKEITTTLVSLMVFIMAGLLLWLSIGVKNWFVQNSAVRKMMEDVDMIKTDQQPVFADEWNAYESREFGFVLRYPALWVVKEQSFIESDSENGKSYTLLFSMKPEEQTTPPNPNTSSESYIGLTLSPSHASLENFSCPSQEKGKTCFSKKVFVFGVPMLIKTLEETENAGGSNKKREIFFMKDGNLFHWYTSPRGIPQDEPLSVLNEKSFIVDQIATSIRFLK